MDTQVKYVLREVLKLKNTEVMNAYRAEGKKMEQSQITRLVTKGIRRYDTAEIMAKVLEKHFGYVTTPEQLIGYKRG